MKALILVGGFGTRLRPLTLSLPKPIVQFANRHMVLHQIEALAKIGVSEVILAVNYQPHLMSETLKQFEDKLNVKISYSKEDEPLGTAGPLALAKDKLSDGEPFFVLNSDVICSFPFDELLQFHQAHGGEGTLMVTKVDEPSKYGVVVSEPETGKILKFVEKPQIYVGNKINAGIYIFNPEILDRIEIKPTSIEKEIFPAMCDDGQLYSMVLPGFWMDVGQPKDFLTGMGLYLNHLLEKSQEDNNNENEDSFDENGNKVLTKRTKNIIPPVMIHETSVIGEDCLIGPNVTLGENCKIDNGVRLLNTTVLSGALIKNNSYIDRSIVGWHSVVGQWVRMENVSVLGEDVNIQNELFINGATVLPHKTIKENVPSPKIII
eukprot:TRINITY_DN628_c0_g2_i1.p1 TRINITY_DN628_c0_g2~~TRINITY_DN628_c0_g2_i1.p1  ORF type:complete len:377 (-),score=139.18 TRINITY_DN628_c0_g2_i1:166-1296(-)